MTALLVWTGIVTFIAVATESALFYLILAILLCVCAFKGLVIYTSEANVLARRVDKAIWRIFPQVINTAFLVESCSRCYENRMGLVSISPNAKSIVYRCENCGKKQYAAAASKDAEKVKKFASDYTSLVEIRKGEPSFHFTVAEAVMPYETTTRGTITKSMRAQVYRRDGGKCVECGSKQNLHYDHILPVARGGATVVENLQLLCQTCNLSKGARI